MAQELMLNCYKRLNDLRLTEQELPLTTGPDARNWKRKVCGVARAFENISAVSGTLTPAEVKDVAQLEQVESIEFDGERAISSNA